MADLATMPARSALGQLGPGSRGSANIPPLPFRGFLGVKKRGNEPPDTEEAGQTEEARGSGTGPISEEAGQVR